MRVLIFILQHFSVLQRRAAWLAAIVVMLCLPVSGCGQTGALYLPSAETSDTAEDSEDNEREAKATNTRQSTP